MTTLTSNVSIEHSKKNALGTPGVGAYRSYANKLC